MFHVKHFPRHNTRLFRLGSYAAAFLELEDWILYFCPALALSRDERY
jgi:hypothetical protein